MAVINACDAVISVDDSLGALQDIKAQSTSVALSISTETGDYKVFGGRWMESLACAQSWEMTINAIFTDTELESHARFLFESWILSTGTDYKEARTVQFDLPDDSGGNKRYSGEAFLESFDFGDMSASEPAPIALTATLKGTGALTPSTIAP